MTPRLPASKRPSPTLYSVSAAMIECAAVTKLPLPVTWETIGRPAMSSAMTTRYMRPASRAYVRCELASVMGIYAMQPCVQLRSVISPSGHYPVALKCNERGSMRKAPSRNLPAETTSFIGRRRELAELRRQLASARLVTAVGTGGAGKSRLAARIASDLSRGFGHGAWLVQLADIRESALVANAFMAGLDLRDQT